MSGCVTGPGLMPRLPSGCAVKVSCPAARMRSKVAMPRRLSPTPNACMKRSELMFSSPLLLPRRCAGTWSQWTVIV